MSYSDLQEIKNDAAREWPGDYKKQIAAIKQRCEVYSRRHGEPVTEVQPTALEQAKGMFTALNQQDRALFIQWLSEGNGCDANLSVSAA